MVKRKLDGAVDKSSADQEIRKSNMTVHNLWKIWRPAPGLTADRQAGWWNLVEAWKFKSLLYVDPNTCQWFFTLFSQGTAFFQQLWYISNAFFGQALLQGCFMKCEILLSPMITYWSLLFIASAIFYGTYLIKSI